MTEAVGNLRANLTADWADFRSEMRRSSDALGKFGNDFAASAGSIARSAAGLFVGFQVTRFISDSIQAAVAAQELEQAFTTAFGDSAQSANAWAEDLSVSLGRSEKTIRETALGFQNLFGEITPTAEAATVASQRFTELAIDFAALKDIRTEDAFRLIQQALAGSTRGVRQYGVDLTATTLRAEALRLGIISVDQELTTEQAVLVRASILMREFGDATGEAGRQAGGAEEEQERLRARLEETRVELGEALLPAITAVQQALTLALEAFNGFFGAIGRGLEQNDTFVIALSQLGQALRGNFVSYERVAAALATVRQRQAEGRSATQTQTEDVRGLSDETAAYSAELGQLAGQLEGRTREGRSFVEQHAGDIERLRDLIDPAGQAVTRFSEQMRIAERAGLDMGDASVTLARNMIEAAGGVDTFKESLETLPEEFRAAIEAMRLEEAKEKLTEYRDELKDFAEELTQEFAPESGVEERVARINEAFREGLISAEVFKEAVAEATGATAREEKLSEAMREQAEERERAWSRLRDTLADVATGTRDAGDAAKQFVTEWLRAQFIEPFLNRLFSNKGTFGGGGGKGEGFDIGGLIVSVFGGGKANGGDVVPGMSYLVGERGRELFTPDVPGKITPADQVGRGGSVINVYTPDANSFRASRRQIAREQRRAQGVE